MSAVPREIRDRLESDLRRTETRAFVEVLLELMRGRHNVEDWEPEDWQAFTDAVLALEASPAGFAAWWAAHEPDETCFDDWTHADMRNLCESAWADGERQRALKAGRAS